MERPEIFFWGVMENPEIFLWGVSLGNWLQTLSVLLATIAIVFSVRQTKRNERKARQRATIDLALHERVDGQFIASRKRFAELRDKDALTALACNEDASKEDNDAIMGYLNHYEFLACGIFEDAIDGELYKRMMRSSVIRDWKVLKPYVMELRNKRNNQKIYCELEKLVALWKKLKIDKF